MMKFGSVLAIAALAALVPVAGISAAMKEKAKAGAVVNAPPAGKGQIVFWRPGSIVGAAIRCTIRENGKIVTRLGPGKYHAVVLDPGPHKFTTKTEATDTLNTEVEADETSYVRCKIGAGVAAGRPNIAPGTKEEFDAKAKKLKQVDLEGLAKDQASDDGK